MQNHISRIQGQIPNTNSQIEITTNGENVIITGINGSGKTSLLREVYKKTELLIVQKKQADLPQLKNTYESYKKTFQDQIKGTNQYDKWKRRVTSAKAALDQVTEGLTITFENSSELSAKIDERHAVVRMFEANRFAQIQHADTARGVETDSESMRNQQLTANLGNSLEQHLVNLKNRRSLALSEDNDQILAKKIESWLNKFEENLKELMEDDSTMLRFNSDTLKFTIVQEGKPPYTFQNLSSGYLAIFDIYADLLMRTEYFTVVPENMTGVVFVDEIDAHLHVSLQRLIMPFLVKSFPQIQFIVTTHSPFVLTSLKDVVVFDIGKNSQLDEDISFYPYSAVMEGLLGAKTTSIEAEKVIEEISALVNSQAPNYERLKLLLDRIKPIEDKLDSRGKAFYLKGVNKILDQEA